ncbi:MAG: hypothetical protein ACK521_03855 [bacterium]
MKLGDAMAIRDGHIMSFLKLERSIALIVFDDGTLWHFNNDSSKETVTMHTLKLPFSLVTQVVFEPEQAMICLENESAEKIFYKYEDESWQHIKLDVSSKYFVIKIFENFMIARYQDGYAFLIELKGDELGLHVQLGDKKIWKY